MQLSLSENIKIFNNAEFGEIRAALIDNEPWFVLKDVCVAFGETNYRRVAARLDDEEKGVSQINTPGGTQSMTVVNEAGLYSALFAMQPEKARGVNEEYISNRQEQLKKFKHWVTHEVLPSIRKHGMYMTDNLLETAIANPDFVIGLIQNARGTLLEQTVRGGRQSITSEIPVAESLALPVAFAKLTSGRGTMATAFSHYAPCPPDFMAERERVGTNPLDRAKYILEKRNALSG